MSDKCSKHVFPEIEEDCPTCNPPKSDGPYKVNEYGNVIDSMDGTIHWCGKYGDDVCLALNVAYHEGRASLIPLVRELVGVLKSCGYVLNGTGPQPPCTRCDDSAGYVCDVCSVGMDVISALEKAKKEIGE
jgi:hypothetical protein